MTEPPRPIWIPIDIAGDHVPRLGRAPADRAGRALVQEDARRRIIVQAGLTGGVGADEITLDQRIGRTGPLVGLAVDLDVVLDIGRDDVAGADGDPADRVVGGVGEDHPVLVAQVGFAGRVDADPVALNLVPRGAVVDPDALLIVGGDQVPVRRGRPADPVSPRTIDQDAGAIAPRVPRPGRPGTDEVAGDNIAPDRREIDPVFEPRERQPLDGAIARDNIQAGPARYRTEELDHDDRVLPPASVFDCAPAWL